MAQFEEYFSFVSDFAHSFINDTIKEDEPEQGAGKQVAKDSKKPGKGPDVSQKEYKKSNSGIESLVVLLDEQLRSLPLEKLPVFKDVGAKSQDVSFFSIFQKIC